MSTITTSPPTDEDKIKIYINIVEKANDKENIIESVDEIKKLGEAARSSDTSFSKITHAFDVFVQDYGQVYPELKNFSTEWHGYRKVSS